MSTDLHEIESFATAVHAGMATGYALTLPYHFRRRQYGYLIIGIAGTAFHMLSVIRHAKRTQHE